MQAGDLKAGGSWPLLVFERSSHRLAGGRPSAATQNGAAPAGEPAAAAAAGTAGEQPEPALQPFTRLTKAATEALRYRAEDVARSLTKSVIKEVS
jgi:hypothetical protein